MKDPNTGSTELEHGKIKKKPYLKTNCFFLITQENIIHDIKRYAVMFLELFDDKVLLLLKTNSEYFIFQSRPFLRIVIYQVEENKLYSLVLFTKGFHM